MAEKELELIMCRHKRRTRIRVGKQMTKEILSFYDREFDYLLCDLKYDAEQFFFIFFHGKMGIV